MYILLRLPELKWTLNDNETVTAQADYYSTPINALMVSARLLVVWAPHAPTLMLYKGQPDQHVTLVAFVLQREQSWAFSTERTKWNLPLILLLAMLPWVCSAKFLRRVFKNKIIEVSLRKWRRKSWTPRLKLVLRKSLLIILNGRTPCPCVLR